MPHDIGQSNNNWKNSIFSNKPTNQMDVKVVMATDHANRISEFSLVLYVHIFSNKKCKNGRL